MTTFTEAAGPRGDAASGSDEPVISNTVKLGWAFGSAGQVSMLYIVNLLAMFFMVTHLGVPPALAGTLLLLARIWDSVVDPPIGALSDRIETRWGRRRPWMAAGAVVSALGILGLFVPFTPPGTTAAYVQLTVGLLLYYTGYSLYSVPGTAMPAEMTDSPDGRTSLMAYRTFFFQIGGVFAAAGLPALIGALGGGREAYAKAGMLAAAFVLVSMLTSVAVTGGTRQLRRSSVQTPFLQYWTTVLGNRPFLVLLGAKFAIFMATASTSAASLFFITQVLGRDERLMAVLQLSSNLAGLAALPLWRRLALRLSKAEVFGAAMVVSGICTSTWLLASPSEPDWVFVVRAIGTGIGSVGTLLMTLSILPDTMEHDFQRTGLRREGVYSGLYEFVTKTAFAFGPFVVGLYLSLNGYVATTHGSAMAQPPQALQAVRITMGLVPPLAYACGLLLLLANRGVFASAPPRRAALAAG